MRADQAAKDLSN